ncbi:MAG: M48 family metalloprotease [Micrococcales bacterium]|nr:M48 family metalloprotease [Micrococcales bacterium]MCL2666565.1 M48 family metalloprotease [Micrococcales bacterium]
MAGSHHNVAKTALLFATLWALLLAVAWMAGGGTGRFLWLSASVGLALTAYSLWNSDKIAIRAMRARPVSELEQPVMYQAVRELSTAARQPMPRLYVSPTMAPNAFATGRSPTNAAVCCTEGILQLLDARELRGVLGHELAHVHNRDTLSSSVAAAVAAMITAVVQFLLLFTTGSGRRPLNPVAALATVVLAPMAAMTIQMAISRTREYDADATAVDLTADPLALADALRKIDTAAQARPLPADQQLIDVSHLMIANPFADAGLSRLFATHPPMDDRIARLEAMAPRR